MIRQFVLINSRGDRWSLNDLDSFGYNPEGLGVSLSNSYINYGPYYMPSGTALNQGKLTMSVVFGAMNNESYIQYHKFVAFMEFGGLILEYSTDARFQRAMLRDCQLAELTKAELNEYSVLDSELTLEFSGPWYWWRYNGAGYADQPGDGKIYVVPPGAGSGYYTYAYIYEEAKEEYAGYYAFDNESVYLGTATGSPIEITVHGPATNPGWDLYNRANEIIQSDRYFVTVPEAWSLVVSSFPDSQRAVLIDPDGNSTNVYQYQDLTKTNFITIPSGLSSLVFSDENLVIETRMRQEAVVV